ncbi:NAD(P)-dependent alcohol dehydrogenase [Paenibacillus sp. MMS18-CY102]|uniref:NAD(P)-dependent alcohol dehydrogenase n=1 Tax=Paenibacillus sp. MMS18-CY102 TaxID=2682849 RepID=UPI001366321D|nr:NAD(P)-dependent alcohol dehydrogenase [Paenibacillus sp. MMS18-CY102]MWC30963.1 zinc-binding dehydrogenase [Paenibacillus sp. MMS18-CY102]
MRAIVYERYGPPNVLAMSEMAKPAPKRGEIRIKVHATSVSAADWRIRKADPFLARLFNGLFRPKRVKTLGFELAGVVDEVGEGVTRFKQGDSVFAYTGLGFGAYAEYVCLLADGVRAKEGIVAMKPANMAYGEAATVPVGGLTAMGFLRKGGIAQGQRVLVYGASGSVGTYAVQIAKSCGADVTGVCSTGNIEMVKSLGADRVVDYTKEDFVNGGQTFDLIFDAVGKLSYSRCKSVLKNQGKYVTVRSSMPFKHEHLAQLHSLIEAGKVRSVIDRTYTLEQIVEAHAYVEQGHKKGNVVVMVEQGL